MRRLKIISCIIILCVFTLSFYCVKTKALSSGFSGYRVSISERNQGEYSYIAIYNLNENVSSFNYVELNSQDFTYLVINNNQIQIYKYASGQYAIVDSFYLSTGILQVSVDYDVTDLYLIIYELSIDLQHYQGSSPSLGGITRTLKTRVILDNSYLTQWRNNDLDIYLLPNSGTLPIGLLNYSYVDANDTLTSINSWVDNQLENSLLINNLLSRAYNYGSTDGYDSGYNAGVADGEDVGYDNGYSEGYDTGYSDGTIDGEEQGYIDGYGVGYDDGYLVGYDDGTQGETIFSPIFAIMQQIFGAIGQFLAIEIAPHLPLGIFVFVPLFFGVVGLILWIWRRN